MAKRSLAHFLIWLGIGFIPPGPSVHPSLPSSHPASSEAIKNTLQIQSPYIAGDLVIRENGHTKF